MPVGCNRRGTALVERCADREMCLDLLAGAPDRPKLLAGEEFQLIAEVRRAGLAGVAVPKDRHRTHWVRELNGRHIGVTAGCHEATVFCFREPDIPEDSVGVGESIGGEVHIAAPEAVYFAPRDVERAVPGLDLA